ncbi:UPF0051 protein ABCI8, chloroplastic [Linum grandiflorum]
MASLLTNGIPRFSSHPFSDSSKLLKPLSISTSSRIRADLTDSATLSSSSSSSSSTSTLTSSDDKIKEILRNRDYKEKFGFNVDIDSFSIPKGLSEDTIRSISKLKHEPDWMLDFRLKAFHKFLQMKEPSWSDNRYPPINFQDLCYYSAPKKKPTLNSLDEADPELLKYFDRLGVPLNEQNRLANVAVDAVLDSVSIATTHRKTLEKSGVIFCSISEAVQNYPDLVKKYLGKVVPSEDNYYAALNSAVFSDGSFLYIPKDTKCPMQISTYFRINAMETGQFERTLIVADDRSFVEYLEGCTAPSYDTNQLHAAVVELYCAESAEIKYSTVQNWYAGDEQGKGGIYNFVTKRGVCAGDRSKISWTQVETGSAITWKYPSVVLEGDNTVGEFYSVALTNNYQQADTGTKMIHKAPSHLLQKPSDVDLDDLCTQYTSSCIFCSLVKNPTGRVEHEASTSKIGEDQLFYFQQRGIEYERAMAAMISGFCRDVFNELPDEFGAEVNQLMSLKLEGSVG